MYIGRKWHEHSTAAEMPRKAFYLQWWKGEKKGVSWVRRARKVKGLMGARSSWKSCSRCQGDAVTGRGRVYHQSKIM